MVARGVGGSLDGQSGRNQMMIDHLDESVELLAMVEPDVIVIAHTATSYHLGSEAEAALLARLHEGSGIRIVTAFGAVSQSLRRLGIKRLALGAPYSAEVTLQGKAHLEANGFEVVNFANLPGHEHLRQTAEDAYAGAQHRYKAAQAMFLTGRHADLAEALEHDSASRSFRARQRDVARAPQRRRAPADPGYGRLLTLD
jgi:maleate cis-trans isomerase